MDETVLSRDEWLVALRSLTQAEVAELADAPDSKSGAFGRVGSIPTFGIRVSVVA
jgi:hypothetical protein